MPSCLVRGCDIDLADDPVRLGPGEIDGQKSVGQVSSQHLHAFGEEKRALELSGGNAAMQEVPGLVFSLPAPDDELVFLQRHLELLPGETGNGKGDAETLGILRSPRHTLDIVGRISISRGFRDTIERLLDLIETQEKRMPEGRLTRHLSKPKVQRHFVWFEPADAALRRLLPGADNNMEVASPPIKTSAA
jgi:hypothetical protein